MIKRFIHTDKKHVRFLKAEWWEVWWHKPGKRPVMHKSDGEPLQDWVPTGVFPVREDAFRYKKACKNVFMKVIHVRRYASKSS